MIQKRAETGIIVLAAVFSLMFTVIAVKYYHIGTQQKEMSVMFQRSVVEITADSAQGTIYDRNMQPLVNTEKCWYAAVVPSASDKEELIEYAFDKEKFSEKYDAGSPFVFECREDTPESEGVTVFKSARRYSENQLAQHIIGYISEGNGVSGLEYAYNKILRGDFGENKVTYYADGSGRVLIGDGKTVQRSNAHSSGIVTTLDGWIQEICEKHGASIEKGAIVCADAETGDILAAVSFPDYSPENLDEALNDEKSPLINRVLYSYGVGSIFKLVTACEGINEMNMGYIYDCTGETDIEGQHFNCHKSDGHGIQDMMDAMTESCNTYFISLSRSFDVVDFRNLASSLGFGKENYLCYGIEGSAGILPTVDELAVPAELANFSFGQGKLTATPLQITQLSCAIANDGRMPVLRLIKGITLDGINVENEKSGQFSEVMDKDTAQKLKLMMISAVSNNKKSRAVTKYTTVGAKTSTAQTGRFDSDGNEYCHGWITGFFPAYKPEYVLTVLVEDGGYGNDAAAPVFSEIADEIMKKS